MAREKIPRFYCRDCPYCFTYGESVPKKVPGAFLKFGGRYCRGGKKTREFNYRDPKVYRYLSLSAEIDWFSNVLMGLQEFKSLTPP